MSFRLLESHVDLQNSVDIFSCRQAPAAYTIYLLMTVDLLDCMS